MRKKHKEEKLINNLTRHLSRIHYYLGPQRCKVHISIVQVNHIDHINWLHNELDIYGEGVEPLIS